MPDDPSSDIVEMTELEMDEAVEAFRHELSRLRSGRASTALLEGLQVNYYGTKTLLRQLAEIHCPTPTARSLPLNGGGQVGVLTGSRRRFALLANPCLGRLKS